ncbi:hypothetical protein BSZ35_06355 [Salinibacter sp. 10B]|uniref:GWxTD domain-containing protein n=1 Tax=Salinibacter sp. 10B TaxID=1923971 RepID=UPI000CF4949E|nr:GWxTD domain-containing protein [Salinibacter sp. 10B]PQJ34270.1 hypothetical protein BSZ35_06355 [Salinibacter sp. 10B]
MMRVVYAVVLVLLMSGRYGQSAIHETSVRSGTVALLVETTGGEERPVGEVWTGGPEIDPKEKIRTPGTYYAFLRFLDDSTSVDRTFSKSVVRRQLDALQAVLSEATVKQLKIQTAAETGQPEALVPGTGRTLKRWWGRRDPYPATEANERLQEHLKRVAHAFRYYHRKDDDDRLDGRGRVYVRYGPPNRSREVGGGEFWTYGFQTEAEFLFVCERGDGCELGQPIELIPPRLRYGGGPTERGMRKALKSLSALESIYKQLSYQRARYGITFTDLSMYNELVRQRLSGMNAPMSVRPHSFLHQKIGEIKQEEVAARRRRETVVPQTRSNVGREFGNVPVAARWVRSLGTDGTTEVALYWSVLRSSLRPSQEQLEAVKESIDAEGGYLLTSSLIRFAESYEREEMERRHFFVSHAEEAQGVPKPRRETFFIEDTSHAALQVDVSWASIRGEPKSLRPQARLKVGTSRADSLTALRNDPSDLEMSDLEPVLLKTDTTSIEEAPVYPFRELSGQSPLALRFELYHLATGPDGRTRYTVTYEVRRTTDRKGFAQLFRGDDQEQTAVESEFQGRNERTEEYVVLSPSDWMTDETQEVRIAVEVTDDRTGNRVSRTVEFELSSKD